jgi:hypothetical protein
MKSTSQGAVMSVKDREVRKYKGYAWTSDGQEYTFSRKDLELVEQYDDDNVVIAEDLSGKQYSCPADLWDASWCFIGKAAS